MAKKTQEVPETVEALPEPTSQLVVTANAGAVTANFEAVAAWLASRLETYAAYEVADESSYAQLKRDRTSLREMIAAVDDERKRVKKAYEAPLKAFEERVRTMLEPAKELDARMKDEVDAYEARCVSERRERMRRAYEGFAPMLVPLVPLERFEEDRWYQRSVTEAKAVSEMEAKVAAIAQGEADVRAMQLPHETEALAEYFATLSVTAARQRSEALEAQERRVREMERQRREMEEAAEEQRRLLDEAEARVEPQEPASAAFVPDMAPEPVPTVTAPQAAPEAADWRVEAWDMTRQQAMEMRDWLKARGIHGYAGHGKSGRSTNYGR